MPILPCLFLVAASVLIHYEALRLLNDRLRRTRLIADRAKVLATLVGALASFVYFSSETYATPGFGDIYPTGPLRLVCGLESLVGLLMVSWTASFTYLEMRRYW